MVASAIQLDVRDGIATLTFNRPDNMNALDAEMRGAFLSTIPELRRIENLRCVVIRGEGKAFMAGGDVKAYHDQIQHDAQGLSDDIRRRVRKMGQSIITLRELPAPTIASVHGAVAGAGIGVMLACDLIIADADTVFTLAYSKIATTPDFGVSWFLPRRIGYGRAAELAMLSERFDAQTALEIGLINKIAESGTLDKETSSLADKLGGMPTQAIGRLKALLNASFQADLPAQINAEADSFADCVLTEDFAEGVSAFVDKRKPDFKGK